MMPLTPRAGRAGARALGGRGRRPAALLAVALLLGACDLKVSNPGPIEDAALNTPSAMRPLVVGMGADLSAVLDDLAYFMGIASGDITHTGAFEAEQFMQLGEIRPEHVNGLWAGMHRARWTAENGIERMKTVLGDAFETDTLAAAAYVWAGYSNRVLGENVCQSVIDGGPPGDRKVHFQRAVEQFTKALELAAKQTGPTVPLLTNAAYAGRAQAKLDLGDYAGAAADAQKVPAGFAWQAQYSLNSDRENNWVAHESVLRAYFSVYGTFAVTANDPRTPWTDAKKNGVDGKTPFYLQGKYPTMDTNIDLAKWDEMRLIEAEAAIRAGDVAGGMAKLNAERAAYNLPPVSAADEASAMAALRHEREIILWMEDRRLWDLTRFDDPFLNGRDRCIPISQDEQATNPNVRS